VLAATDSIHCDVTVKPSEPPTVVVAGEVNYESSSQIKDIVEELWSKGWSHLYFDCQSVDFIDSSGIGVIVHCARKLRDTGGRLVLLGAKSQLVHALQVSGFADQVDIGSISCSVPQEDCLPLGEGVWQQVRFSIPLRADRDGLVRKRVTELAENMPFTREQIDDIRLAVGEAVSNAIRHGCPNKECDRLSVLCIGDRDKLIVEISNPGQPFDPDAIPIPDPANPREGGMGIFFMRASMDEVEYSFDETGTTVRMIKYSRKTDGAYE